MRVEVPERFWSLFRSRNRKIYIEALLKLNEEYEYSSYYLSMDVCNQVLSDYFSGKKYVLEQEELETELEVLETDAKRVLNFLVKTKWLRRLDDYNQLVTNIVIPDYAAIFIDAFARLYVEEEEEAEVYIQNVYANLFSFRSDPGRNHGLLKTAMVNTRKLNKSLQDMLHNMDKFFSSLLEQEFYGDLLREHLDGYVEEIIRKKYHILKTSDNFYMYKADIKKWLMELEQDLMVRSETEEAGNVNEILDIIEAIGRGFDDIERRIANMDQEHNKYVRATVVRLNYLLSGDGDMKGLVVQLLGHLRAGDGQEERLSQVAEKMNLSDIEILGDRSLYQKRQTHRKFMESLEEEEPREELSAEDILKLNKVKKRYSREQIEEFLDKRRTEDTVRVEKESISTEEEFEKLILAYDYALKRNSRYEIEETEERERYIEDGAYTYPALTFRRRSR